MIELGSKSRRYMPNRAAQQGVDSDGFEHNARSQLSNDRKHSKLARLNTIDESLVSACLRGKQIFTHANNYQQRTILDRLSLAALAR